MSTAAERTIDIPFESRKVYIPRGTTSDDRTVLIKFESRTVYIERQSTSATYCDDNGVILNVVSLAY